MMNFLKLIEQRESVRSYDPNKKLSHDVLLQIAEAGRLAPSAANRQPWRFVFVSSPEMLLSLHNVYNREWFAEAPHILLVIGDKSKSWIRSDGYNSVETDLAIVMDHMILMAESLGIASCWVGNFDYLSLRNLLNLSDTEEVFALTPLGYAKQGFAKKILKQGSH